MTDDRPAPEFTVFDLQTYAVMMSGKLRDCKTHFWFVLQKLCANT